jgi:hypothetical protein
MTKKMTDDMKLGKEATRDEKLSCREAMFSKAKSIGFSQKEIALLELMYKIDEEQKEK